MQSNKVQRDLTSRQKQIIKLLYLQNKEIARALGIATKTVANSISNIQIRLGTWTRTEILIKCLKEGKIELEEIYYR